MTIDLVATRAGFVYKMQMAAFGNQLPNNLVQGFKAAVYFSIIADLTIAAPISECNFYGIFVNIHTDECAILFHGLPPCFWLCDGFGFKTYHHNPRIQGWQAFFSILQGS